MQFQSVSVEDGLKAETSGPKMPGKEKELGPTVVLASVIIYLMFWILSFDKQRSFVMPDLEPGYFLLIGYMAAILGF